MQNEMNDKMLREKLGTFTAPYDVQGWEQMSAMLDNRKKRRGFFWWWLSGTSMAAVMATLGLFLLTPRGGMENFENRIVGNGNLETWNAGMQKEEFKGVRAGGEINAARNENFTASSNSNQVAKQHSQSSSTQKTLFISSKESTSKIATPSSKKYATKNNSPLAEMPAVAQVREDVLFTSLNAQPASLLTFNEVKLTASDEKLSDDGSIKLPVKRKKFNYELGIVSGTSAAFTQQHFHNKANWFAGLQQAFRIGKYVAVTNGIQYAKTAFAVNRVTNTDSAFSPSAYSSKIHSFSIPIGVNVYPISSKCVDWYVSAGVVNNIKIKEAMRFELPSASKQMDNLQNIPTTSGNVTVQHFSLSNEETVNIANYRNGSARYFANFYTTTGVEIKLLPALLMNTGFSYQISLSNTGKQQARPMFFGGELGLRYRF